MVLDRGVRMNLETINKWLDEEYGCSYTKLEELHDFYFEKYCDLKQENKQLKDNWNKLKEYIGIKLYNVEYLQKLCGCRIDDEIHIILDIIKKKIQELEKGSDSNE